MVSLPKGVESWVLMALIFKDLDDYDFSNALVLSERLFAIDNNCEDFRLLYAKCHYMLKDYNAANDLLKNTTTIPCLFLYGRTCLELGILKNKTEEKLSYWHTGIQSLQQALSDYTKLEIGQHWGDDLACVSIRSHMPSEASIHKLLGELYGQMKKNDQSIQHLVECLTKNRFKLSAYINMGPSSANILPKTIFSKFTRLTPLTRSSTYHIPQIPSKILSSTHQQSTCLSPKPLSPSSIAETEVWALITSYGSPGIPIPSAFTSSTLTSSSSSSVTATKSISSSFDTPLTSSIVTRATKNQHDNTLHVDNISPMPLLRSSYSTIPFEILQEVIADHSYKSERKLDEKKHDELGAPLAEEKNEELKNDNDNENESTTEMAYEFTVNLKNDSGDPMDSDDDFGALYRLSSPPRLERSSKSKTDQNTGTSGNKTGMKKKRSSGKISGNEFQPSTTHSIDSYFIPWLTPPQTHHPIPNKRPYLGKTTTGTSTNELATISAKNMTDQTILNAMNNIMELLLILAKAYHFYSNYYCGDTVMELQTLDDSQYDTPSILCLMGRAYYDAGDYERAHVFYQRSFCIAPWYCQDTHLYSTCLYSLEKKDELDLLTKVTKDNQVYLYESYIAAGNLAKCDDDDGDGNEWFQKAIDLDPNRSYGYGCLGYGALAKENYWEAREHFLKHNQTNRQHYLGWYGLAKSHQCMKDYREAQAFIQQAIKLHPRHPQLLGTMAEILWSIKEYRRANEFVEKSLTISNNNNKTMQQLRNNIKQKLAHSS